MIVPELKAIPSINIPVGATPALISLHAAPERLELLLASARKTYTPRGLRASEHFSRVWARRVVSPYAPEILEVDRALGRPGAFLLNYSYEWGCTSGAVADPDFGGMTLLRTLDWPFDGLGRALVLVRQTGRAGDYFNLTWPGYVGILTANAPGRFAAAINQPPLPTPFGPKTGGPLQRWRVGASREIPPDHLLRRVFDACEDFDAAHYLLRSTPICIPAIFTLVGAKSGEAVVIERTEHQAFSLDEAAAANHWTSRPGPQGRPRDRFSRPRRLAMCDLIGRKPDWSLAWMRPPIHVATTRLALMANPASGRLVARGFEKSGPVTEILRLG